MPLAERRTQRAQVVGVASSRDRHGPPVARQGQRERPPDAAGAARDERHPLQGITSRTIDSAVSPSKPNAAASHSRKSVSSAENSPSLDAQYTAS